MQELEGAAWHPSAFNFAPYQLKAEPGVKPEPFDSMEACGPLEDAGLDSKGARRKPGRQKRTSVVCQVPGCGAELVDGKTYYKRYRICLTHCNMPGMVIDGMRQRFCQQCGRFHDIVEFETTKKSCRRKLKRHNERRRSAPSSKKKWGSESEGEEDRDSYDSAELQAVANIKRRHSQRARGAALLPGPAWPTSSEDTDDGPPPLCPEPRLANLSPLTAGRALPAALPSQLRPAGQENGSGGGLGQMQVHAMRARSLESSQHTLGETLEQQLLALPQGVGGVSPATSRLSQPAALEELGSTPGSGEVPGLLPPGADPFLDSVLEELLNDEELRDQLQPEALEMLSMETDMPLLSTAEEFSLLPPSYLPYAPQQQAAQYSARQAPAMMYMEDPLPALANDIPMMPLPHELSRGMAQNELLLGPAPAAAPSLRSSAPLPSAPGVDPSVLASAFSMLGREAAPLVGYVSGERLTRMSLKVFNCTPDQLVPAVRSELQNLLHASQTLLEGYIRPGCTHLTFNALMPADKALDLENEGVRCAVERLLAHAPASAAVLDMDMLVQLHGELAVVKGRKVVAVISTQQSEAMVPRLAALRPLVLSAPAGAAGAMLELRGVKIAGPCDLPMVRQQGLNLAVEVNGAGRDAAGDWLRVRVLGLQPGGAEVEVQHGGFVSDARPLVVVPTERAAEELRSLERGVQGIDNIEALLRDLGVVVQYLQRAQLAAAGRALPQYTPTLLAAIAGMARGLVAAAVARGWTECVSLLLPAVCADGSDVKAAVAAMDACCPPGCTLLHVAVGTSSTAVLDALAAWGCEAGYAWQLDVRGTNGVTPLHVAALVPNSQAMRGALAEMNSMAGKLWGVVQAEDGTTPEGLVEALSSRATRLAQSAAPKAGGSSGSSSQAATQAAASAAEALCALKPGEQEERQSWQPRCQAAGESKGRAVAKRQLDDMHMSAILKDMAPASATRVLQAGPLSGPAATSKAGVYMAVVAGAAAVALHALGFGL